MRRVESSWKVIEGVLQEHARSIFKALRRPAAANAIAKLEATSGVKLPRSLSRSLLTHDGMRQEDFVDYFRLLSVNEMKSWRRISLENPWDESGPKFACNQRIKGDLRWRPKWIPIAVDAGGNLLSCDLDPGPAGSKGQVFKWHNYGSFEPTVLAASYAGWLDSISEKLSQRQFKLDKYGGIHLLS